MRSGVSKAVKSRTVPRAKKKKEENERWSYDLIDWVPRANFFPVGPLTQSLPKYYSDVV